MLRRVTVLLTKNTFLFKQSRALFCNKDPKDPKGNRLCLHKVLETSTEKTNKMIKNPKRNKLKGKSKNQKGSQKKRRNSNQKSNKRKKKRKTIAKIIQTMMTMATIKTINRIFKRNSSNYTKDWRSGGKISEANKQSNTKRK